MASQVLAFTLQIDGINNLNDLKKSIKETTELLNSKDINSPEYKALQKTLAELKAAQAALNMETRHAADASRFASGSYDEMNAKLGALRRKFKELGDEERKSAIGSGMLSEIQRLDRELKQFDASIGQYQRNVGNYASAFNGFGNILASLGITVGISEITNATADFSLKLSELQSITGVSGEDLEKLKVSISDLTSITVEGGKTIVSTGADIAEAFKLAGSARPELLSNTEALADFTKKAIVFAKSGSLPVQDAITALSSTLAQFEKPASDASQVMNVLAAGAKAGASEIKDTTAAIEQFGAGASSANVSVEESVALVETLGDKFLKGSEAGVKIRNILTTIKAPQGLDKKAQDELNKYGVSFEVLSNTALPLSERLRELSKIQGDANALIQVFGKENITAGEILLNNIDRFDELTTAVTGTNEAYKQAAINADNLAQLLSNLKNGAINLAVGIGNTLYKAINVLIGALDSLAGFINDNKVALLAAGFAVAAYSASLNSTRLVLLSFQAVQAANTLVTNAAAIAQKGLALAMEAVPYVAVGIAVYGLVKAMQAWFGSTEEQIKTQEILLQSQKELSDAYASEAQSAAELFAIAKSDISNKEQKEAAAKRLIELYPSYLGGIKTEAELLNKVDTAQNLVNKGILEGVIARIKAQKIQEATTSLIDLELKKQQLLFEFQKQGIDTNSSFAATALSQLQGNIDEVKKRIADLPVFLSKVGEGLSSQNIDFTGISVSDDQIKEVRKQLEEVNNLRRVYRERFGKEIEGEAKDRYNFLVNEEKRLLIERQKLIEGTLNSEQVAAQKSVAIVEDAEAKKDKVKDKKGKNDKEIETLDTLKAKLAELQAKLEGLKDTPSKIPTSLFDDISKTKKEIDELTEKLRKAGLLPTAQNKEIPLEIKLDTTFAKKNLAEYLSEKEKANKEANEKQLKDDIQTDKEMLELKRASNEKAAQDEINKRKELNQLLLNTALDLAREISDNVFSIQKAANEKELENKTKQLETAQQAELDLAGNNATLTQRINERYAAQKLALDKKAFEENKKLQIAQALINGALAATAVFAVPDFTFGIASAARLAFIAANTALQVGIISEQKFADGGFVQGAGTGTSDSISAKLSNGEFVLRAAATEAIGVETLNVMNKTGQIPATVIPSALSGGSSNRELVEAIVEGVTKGAYMGTQSGVNDGLVQVNRENNVINKLTK